MRTRSWLLSAVVFPILTSAGLALAAGETINVGIGTLPAGKSVTVIYDVTVNAATPPATTSLSQQGTVSGSNFSNVLTDDPDAPGASDPTVTLLANEIPVAGFGKMLTFNGSNQYVLVPDAGALSASSYTVETWVKFDTIRDTAIITRNIADDTAPVFGLYLNAAGNFVHVAYDGSVRQITGTTVAATGRWYHVAGVYNNTTNGMRLFVNGVEEGTALTPGSLGGLLVPHHFAFGRGIDAANYLQGQLDEVRVWNTPRSGSDIASWMYRASDMSHPLYGNLGAYYKLDDGTGTTAAASRGSINGTLQNMTNANWLDSTVNEWYTDEDVALTSGKLVGSDADGASTDGTNWVLTFELVTDGTKGHVVIGPDNSFTYTPNANANGNDTFSYRVKDALLATSNVVTIPVQIAAVNDAPVMDAIGNRMINELATLAFTVGVTDPDDGQALAFSLDAGAPEGAAINPTSGAFSWTPTEAQGPGNYPVTIRVTDNGIPVLDDFETIQITVNEVNSAPVLAQIGNRTVNALENLTFTAMATDSDLPANTLVYSLDAGAPSGASINAASGIFSWTPTKSQAPGTYPVTVRVTDNGVPVLDDAETIQITVNALPATVTTNAASGLYAFGATVNGTVNDNGYATTVTFDYGTTDSYGAQAPGGTVSADAGATAVTADLTGLVCGTTYHFRVTATNAGGVTNGSDQTFATIPCPPVLHAIPGGASTGSCEDWAHGCELRYALANAVAGEEIWAQAGVYKPTATTTDRTATFQLKSGVAVYGGFAGSETDRNARNWTTNPTILSGDIDGNDSQTPVITNIYSVSGTTANSYHVVTGASGALLDGFTITGGNANGVSPASNGGGLYNASASLSLANCTFSGNSAFNSGHGGGLYNATNSSSTLSGCTFASNWASWGGGIYNTGTVTASNTTFSGNRASYGAGMHNYNGSTASLDNCTFSGNIASVQGGALLNQNGSTALTNCTFAGNNASSSGGAIMYIGGTASVTNCTFSDNSAPSGAGIQSNGSNPIVRNSILWDSGNEINAVDGSPVVSYSVIQGGYAGTGNSSSNPLLAPLGNYGGVTQTTPLLPGSAAIDSGDAATCAAADQRGITRPQGSGCDMGAFESSGFTLAKTGDNQTAVVSTPFAAPLGLTVTATNTGEPVNGGTVTLTPPASGAGISVTTPITLTIAGGTVSQSISANDTTGSYGIAVATTGATGDSFSLTNVATPDTVIDSQPANPDTLPATFIFHGTGGVSPLSFECQLDGTGWSSCASPQSHTGLNAASHTFEVRTVDNAGNRDATPASYTWTVVPTLGISAIIFDGANGYAAQNGSGIWRTTDGGATWAAAATQPANQRIKGLVIHPTTRTTLFAASYGGGIFTSEDSGDTWSVCGNGNLNGAALNILALSIDPGGNLYAGTEGGIFTSSDGCASWLVANGNGLPNPAVNPPTVVVTSTTPERVHAAFYGAGIYNSNDSGASWSAATTQPGNTFVKALAIKPGDPGKLFAATYGGGVFTSSNSGVDWSACTNTNLTNLNVVSLTSNGSGKLYAGTEAGVLVSTDNCSTWTLMSAGLP